jgi:hypothetical protein
VLGIAAALFEIRGCWIEKGGTTNALANASEMDSNDVFPSLIRHQPDFAAM